MPFSECQFNLVPSVSTLRHNNRDKQGVDLSFQKLCKTLNLGQEEKHDIEFSLTKPKELTRTIDYLTLRQKQNKIYSSELVKQGQALADDGNYHSAVELYFNALEMDPDSIEAVLCRGEALAKQGLYGEARKDFDHVLSVDPDNERVVGDIKWIEECQDSIAAMMEQGKGVERNDNHAADDGGFLQKNHVFRSELLGDEKQYGDRGYAFEFREKRKKARLKE